MNDFVVDFLPTDLRRRGEGVGARRRSTLLLALMTVLVAGTAAHSWNQYRAAAARREVSFALTASSAKVDDVIDRLADEQRRLASQLAITDALGCPMQASDVAATITNLMPERTSLSLLRLELADPAPGAPRAFAVTIRGFARGNADLYELERRLTARGSFAAVTVSENAPTDTPGGRVQQFTVTCRMPLEEPAGSAAPGARVARSGGSR